MRAGFDRDGTLIGFFPAGLAYADLPERLVEVSAAQHRDHLDFRALLSLDEDGRLRATPPAAPDRAELLAACRTKLSCSKLGAKRVLSPLGIWGELRRVIVADRDLSEYFELADRLRRTDPEFLAANSRLAAPLCEAALDLLFHLAGQAPLPEADIVAAFRALPTSPATQGGSNA